MERLTKRELSILGDVCYCKCHSNDCDYECDECNILSEGANKLKAYEDAEEQVLKATGVDLQSMIGEFMHYYNLQKEGMLVELPCKVGDTAYYIHREYLKNADKWINKIDEVEVESFVVNVNLFSNVSLYIGSDRFSKTLTPYKTLFFTKEEAEAALERMK